MNSSSILSCPSRQESPHPGECALKSPSKRKGCGSCLMSSVREFFEMGVLGDRVQQPIGRRGSALPSHLGRRKWPRRHVDELQPLLPGRHHLNLQDPPLPPIQVAPHGKQGAHIVGVSLSIISSNMGCDE
ncbi:hypothetical protein PoB_005334400 [Plakobranchus ocellatus]|uniref:Uncharacterized protein n=1 Tax=Plakobranchus ocellatus TaxID=259542 RepID=A0AAV4C2U8_9GAST|nr:hypothetical protein PoB_005334400 [Plakobranchus ocellatus]